MCISNMLTDDDDIAGPVNNTAFNIDLKEFLKI